MTLMSISSLETAKIQLETQFDKLFSSEDQRADIYTIKYYMLVHVM